MLLISCTDSTQCCAEENEIPAAEIIMANYQFMRCDDKKTELVIGKEIP